MKNMNRALWSMNYLDEYDASDIEEVVNTMKILESEFEKIDQFLDIGDIASAENNFDQILLNYYLPEDLAQETSLFSDWIVMRSSLINSNRSWADVTSTELNTLYNMVDQYRTWTGRAAMQVLNEFHNEIFQLPPAFSQQWDPRVVGVFADSNPVVEAYLNPASDLVFLSLSSPLSTTETGSLKVVDALGREMYTSVIISSQQHFVLEVRDWSSGFYVYHISLPSFGKITGKFNVQQ